MANRLRLNELGTTIRQLSNDTLCQHSGFPDRKCVDRKYEKCGIHQPLIQAV